MVDGAYYQITDIAVPNEINIITLSNNLYAVLITNTTLNIKQFGAKGDGVQDDTSYIQEALNTLQDNGVLYFPKGKKCNYLITKELILSANDCLLYSDSKTEYSTKITCNTANITMMLITGYGVTIKNLAFYGNGTETTYSTVNALNFNRTSLGDAEIYSNIDCVIEDCLFYNIRNCITIKGRNARIKNNTFSLSKNGIIVLLHKYNSETDVSECRGYYIQENVFHSMNYNDDITKDTISTLDSWCIQTPLESDKVGNIQIQNNKAEFCFSGFYKGYVSSLLMTANQLYFSTSCLIYSDNKDASLANLTNARVNLIANNTVVSNINNLIENFIYISNQHNNTISNNSFRSCHNDAIYLDTSNGNLVENNFIMYYAIDNVASAINLVDGNGSYIKGNFFRNTRGTDINCYGVSMTTYNYLQSNIYINCTTKVNTNPQFIVNSFKNSESNFYKPDLVNNFTYNNRYTQGVSILENGMRHLQIGLENGTDNSIAFTLPEGYRPSHLIAIPNCNLSTQSDNSYALLNTDGTLFVNWGNTQEVYIIDIYY